MLNNSIGCGSHVHVDPFAGFAKIDSKLSTELPQPQLCNIQLSKPHQSCGRTCRRTGAVYAHSALAFRGNLIYIMLASFPAPQSSKRLRDNSMCPSCSQVHPGPFPHSCPPTAVPLLLQSHPHNCDISSAYQLCHHQKTKPRRKRCLQHFPPSCTSYGRSRK